MLPKKNKTHTHKGTLIPHQSCVDGKQEPKHTTPGRGLAEGASSPCREQSGRGACSSPGTRLWCLWVVWPRWLLYTAGAALSLVLWCSPSTRRGRGGGGRLWRHLGFKFQSEGNVFCAAKLRASALLAFTLLRRSLSSSWVFTIFFQCSICSSLTCFSCSLKTRRSKTGSHFHLPFHTHISTILTEWPPPGPVPEKRACCWGSWSPADGWGTRWPPTVGWTPVQPSHLFLSAPRSRQTKSHLQNNLSHPSSRWVPSNLAWKMRIEGDKKILTLVHRSPFVFTRGWPLRRGERKAILGTNITLRFLQKWNMSLNLHVVTETVPSCLKGTSPVYASWWD